LLLIVGKKQQSLINLPHLSTANNGHFFYNSLSVIKTVASRFGFLAENIIPYGPQ
jgi:hypothetical protein